MIWKKIASINYECNKAGEIRHSKSKKKLVIKMMTGRAGVIVRKGGKIKHLCVSHIIYRIYRERNYYRMIRKGREIHHKDLNPMNNNINNLKFLTRKQHSRIHQIIRNEKVRNL